MVIVVHEHATAAERYAAAELCAYISKLYNLSPLIVPQLPLDEAPSIVLGDHWPSLSLPSLEGLSDDGFMLKSLSHNCLYIAGRTARGTLYGIYELLQRWGMTFLLSGDVFPQPSLPMRLADFDETFEPTIELRGVRPMANLPEGSAAWDLNEFTGFIDQMIKLKFNAFVFVVLESGPWLDYEFRGTERPAGDIFYGYRFPIGDNFIGAHLFAGQTEFYSPELAKAQSSKSRKQLGISLLKKIIAHCHARGVQTVLTFSLLEPPTAFKRKCNEWAALPLPDPSMFAGAHCFATPAEEFGINPEYAAWMNVTDPSIQELISHRLKSLINTYPEADYYHLWVSEHRAGVVDPDALLPTLRAKYDLDNFDWQQVLEDHASSPFDEKRYRHQLKGDLLFLFVLDKLLNEEGVLAKTVKPDAKIGVGGVMPQLAPIVTQVLPASSVFVQFLDYGSHGPARQINRLDALLDAHVPMSLEIGIHDDNNMYIPQANVQALHRIFHHVEGRGLKGYVAALWQIRQADIGAAYISAASWRKAPSADAFYLQIFSQLLGDRAAGDFIAGQRIIEQVDASIRNGPLYGYAFLLNDRLVESFITHGVNQAEILRIEALLEQAAVHFRQSYRVVTAQGKPFIDFWLTRTKFALEWGTFAILCDEYGMLAGERAGTPHAVPAVSSETESQALSDLLRRSQALIELIAGDVADKGDLGQIAVLNQHMHAPIIRRQSKHSNLAGIPS